MNHIVITVGGVGGDFSQTEISRFLPVNTPASRTSHSRFLPIPAGGDLSQTPVVLPTTDGPLSSVVRYPRYLDIYRRYLRDDTSIAKLKGISWYIVAVENTVRRCKYHEYRRYHTARTSG